VNSEMMITSIKNLSPNINASNTTNNNGMANNKLLPSRIAGRQSKINNGTLLNPEERYCGKLLNILLTN